METLKANSEFWATKIERMLQAGDYEYGRDTLEGIAEYVETHGRITDKQIQAIHNIKRGGDRL